MRAPDAGAQDAATLPADPAPWPVVCGPSTRFVVLCRAGAVLALAYAVTLALLAAGEKVPETWLWVAIGVGGLVHLTGVAGLWLLPPRTPRRVLPRPGPGAGTEAARRRARRALRSGDALDAEQRRLVAVEVAAGARVPVVAAAAFALLGPVAMGTPNTRHPLPWLGPATAGLLLVILVGLALQVRAVRRLHLAAQRADALPEFEGREAPYLP